METSCRQTGLCVGLEGRGQLELEHGRVKKHTLLSGLPKGGVGFICFVLDN